MPLSMESTIRLNNGLSMPLLGLGVYLMRPGRETYEAVRAALDAGYRLVDTASFYGNEEDVGKAVRDSGVPRGEVFITTKLWNTDHGRDAALRAFEGSLERLGLGYIDLYLIHFPVPRLRGESWRTLEKVLAAGKARAIGVSNYTERHLEELLRTASAAPAVNQVEFSPFLYQQALLAYCMAKGIRLEAYAPLTAGQKLDDERITGIAAKHGRTSAQVLLRWAVQHGVVVIPKSRRPDRIRENARIFDFELPVEDIAVLDRLHDGFRSSWDPTAVP